MLEKHQIIGPLALLPPKPQHKIKYKSNFSYSKRTFPFLQSKSSHSISLPFSSFREHKLLQIDYNIKFY
jgi:hypothetical protein